MGCNAEQGAPAPLQRELQHQAVAELGKLALGGCPLDVFLNRAVAELGRCLDVRFVKLLELSADGALFTVRAGIGWNEGIVGSTIDASDAGSQAGFTLLNADPVVVHDVLTEARFAPPPLLSDHGIVCGASVIVGPLDNPWGVIGVHESEMGRCAFDRYDVDFVRSVANIVWLFIRNLRDRREVERERQELRSFADAMPILFAVVGADGRYEYVNRAHRAFGMDRADIVGRPIADLLDPDGLRIVERHAAQALAGHVVSFEGAIRLGASGTRDVLVTFAPRRAKGRATDGFYAATVDITDQKRRQREIQERNQQYRAIADSIPYGIWTCDRDGRLTYISDSFLELVGMSFEHAADFGWLSTLLPDDAEETRAAWQDCVARRDHWEREHRFRGQDGRHYDILAIARPVTDDAGELFGYVGLNLDITERKRREETLALVSAELDHRVKNIFALVLTIARQASRTATDVDAFRTAFDGRIRALAAAHQMIAENEWQEMSLSRLVRAELEPYRGADRTRWRVEGPELRLPVPAVQPLALALHELATNAAKYGAFAGAEGTVSVRWALSAEGAVRLVWEEAGLSGVTRPANTGFGARVLRQVLVMQLGADVEMDFRETGLKVEIVLPPGSLRAT
jgi:PAS domain S-box-containing protein